MSAKDFIHDKVKNALIKDGWIITDDPFTLEYEDATAFVDLGAERVIAAEKDSQKIAVEIKSFVGRSALQEIEAAIGQYMVYLYFLEQVDPSRKLYVAVSDIAFETIFARKSVSFLVKRVNLSLIVVNLDSEEVVLWKQ